MAGTRPRKEFRIPFRFRGRKISARSESSGLQAASFPADLINFAWTDRAARRLFPGNKWTEELSSPSDVLGKQPTAPLSLSPRNSRARDMKPSIQSRATTRLAVLCSLPVGHSTSRAPGRTPASEERDGALSSFDLGRKSGQPTPTRAILLAVDVHSGI